MANNFNNPNAWWNTPNYATALDRTSANPLFQIPQNYPQTQNLPTTINLDWLNNFQNTQPSSQNRGGFLNLQPYYSQVNYPRTDIDFLNLNSDGVKYSRNEDGTLGRVAGVSKTVENAPEIAATEAGQTEKQLFKTQATPVNAQQQSQTTAPVQQTTIADAIKNYKSSLDALNGNQNPTQLLNLKDARTSILPVIPDRNQYNNNSLLKLQNIEPENWTPQQWGWMGDIYSAKMAYEADTANIDWYNQQLAKTDLSDADRKKYTDARDGLIKQRENVMNEAAMIRRTALANGFDIDAMGMSALGDNLGASTQAMNYFQERNRKSLLDLPTPKQFNNQRRKELDEQGYGAFHSLMLADKETSDYIDDASNRLLYAMQMDGTTNGVINNNGIGYLKKLSKIDPTSANIFMQEYASPAQGLQLQTQTLNNILNNDSALQRVLLNNQANMQQLLARLASTEKIANMNNETNIYRIDSNNYNQAENRKINWSNLDVKQKQLALETEKAANKLILENQKMWNNSPEGKVYQATMLGRYLGYEGKDLDDFVMAQFKQIPNADKRQVAYNEFDSTSKDIENFIKNGEFEKAKESINALNDKIRDFSSDFKYVSLDDREIWAGMLDIYQNAANRQYKPGEFDKLLYDFKHRTTSPAGNGDAYMAELMNNPERVKGIYEQYKKWNIPTFKGNMAEQILKFNEYAPYFDSSLASIGNNQNAAQTGYGAAQYPQPR